MGSRNSLVTVGGVLLVLAALIIGTVPIAFATELAVVGGAFTVIGLSFAVIVGVCGVVTLLQPQYALFSGIAGIVFSILSLIGALGGLFVGMVVGIVGGALAGAGGFVEMRDDA